MWRKYLIRKMDNQNCENHTLNC